MTTLTTLLDRRIPLLLNLLLQHRTKGSQHQPNVVQDNEYMVASEPNGGDDLLEQLKSCGRTQSAPERLASVCTILTHNKIIFPNAHSMQSFSQQRS